MTKIQKILSGVLVLQIGLIGWVFWPKETTNTQKTLLLGDLKADNVVDLKITDDTGKMIHFAKSGSAWIIPEVGEYPADGEKIQSILESIAKIDTGRMITETEASHKQLQVADTDYSRKVDLVTADGTELEFFVGSSAGASAVHVRKSGDAMVYLTGEVSSYELDTSSGNWIDTTYVNVPSTAITAISISNQNADLIFQKDSSGGWQLSGLAPEESVIGSAVDRIAGSAAVMRMVEPISIKDDPEFGLDTPSATVIFTSEDEEGNVSTHQILIGGQDDNGNYYTHYLESEYIVTISAYTAEQFTNAVRSDFVETPATPTSPAVE